MSAGRHAVGVNVGFVADLLVALDRSTTEPAHAQLERSIRDAVRRGGLQAGASLPSSRTLAAELGLSRGVVVEAYQQLTAEGYLASRPGGYTRVAAGPAGPSSRPTTMSGPRTGIDFGYGRADLSYFPRAAWLRSVRTVLNEAPIDRLNYLTGYGQPELRAALVAYLGRVRGTVAEPDDIVVCNGYAQGITLLMDVLARRGSRRIAVEDPTANDDAVPAAVRAGMEVIGVPVGADGVRIEALAEIDADALVLTPSHQWPTGGVLSAADRRAVLEWARRRHAIVIEDDYDVEYRYDRLPLPAMQGTAPDLVVYAGTASKTLAPGLRLGWLLLPAELRAEIAAAKQAADRGSSAMDQLTFADLLTRGEFDRHLRRMRPVYRARRDALLEALSASLPHLEPVGAAAGTHLVAWLPESWIEAEVVAAAAEHGVTISGIGPYRLSPGRGGLLFGYSNLSEDRIRQGVELLAEAVHSIGG